MDHLDYDNLCDRPSTEPRRSRGKGLPLAGPSLDLERRRATAASVPSGTGSGRGTSSGHSAPSGQWSENHCIARSYERVPRSPPARMRASRLPSLNTSVETRAPLREQAASYTSDTRRN